MITCIRTVLANSSYFKKWQLCDYDVTIDNMESLLETAPIGHLTGEEFAVYDKPFINSTERKLLEEMVFHEKAKDLHEKADKAMLLRYADLHCSIINSIYECEQYSCKTVAIFETEKEYILAFHYGATTPVNAKQITSLNEWYYKIRDDIEAHFSKDEDVKNECEFLYYFHDDISKDDITIHIKPKEKGYWPQLESARWAFKELQDLTEAGY